MFAIKTKDAMVPCENDVEIETLSTEREEEVMRLMAEEFLRKYLGVKTDADNVSRFMIHIRQFEKEIGV